MAVIYGLSTDHLSFPGFRQTWTGFLAAKSVHLIEYAVLSLLWYRARVGRLSSWNSAAAMFAFAAASLYAILDEIHQSFTAERAGTVKDVFLDMFGAQLSLFAVWSVHYRSALNTKGRLLANRCRHKGTGTARVEVGHQSTSAGNKSS
jgi:hypothetical protein